MLRDFAANSYSALGYAERLVDEDCSSLSQEQIKGMTVDALIVEYKNIFASEGRGRSGENLQDFHEAIALIGSYTTIPVESDEQ